MSLIIDSPPRTAEELRAGVAAALEDCQRRRAALKGQPADADYAELVHAFDRMTLPLARTAGWVRVLARSHPDGALREVCEAAERELKQFTSDLSLDAELYAVIARLEGRQAPDPEQRRVVERAAREFRRAGVDRTAEEREALSKLRAELVECGQRFDRNIIGGGRKLVVKGGHAAMAGAPADLLAANPERADGSVELDTDPGTRIPLLTYAANRELRRDYHRVAMQRAHPENEPELATMLRLRHDLAGRLGYANWAAYATEDKMSGSPQRVRGFLDDLVERLAPSVDAELATMLEALRETDPSATEVREYDRLHLVDRLRAERFQVDSRALRSYFEYGRVRDGVLRVAARLFGVSFAPSAGVALWHDSIEAYDMSRDGQLLGRLFLDMHPRDGKFKHACLMSVASGVSGEQLPEGVLLCNFPATTEAGPGLLSHDQVTTYFHEFGHLMHHLLASEHRFASFAGIATEWDFVEVPSQLLEEWAWDAEVLADFARHIETDEPLPAEVARAMAAADGFGRATHNATQLVYATYSLELYDRSPEGLVPDELFADVRRRLSPFPVEAETFMHTSFGHLNSYTALYYTYLWSLSISKDFFGAFRGDPFGAEVASAYRSRVLERGGAADAEVLVRDFLGREPSTKAFEDWLVGSA